MAKALYFIRTDTETMLKYAIYMDVIQGDRKVSVHLTITVHHQVHRDFLITL